MIEWRRSAMISLSNLSDERMRHAKSGAWWEQNGQRALANNSACYTERPEVGVFMQEWLSLYESKSGERGIFNREAAKKVVARNGRRSTDFDFGTNPCSEIILRPYQFCNLSTVVVRAEDTLETLKEKVRLASILGTWQSTLTNFPYLRKIWQRNTEEERLLGVSMTGALDNKLFNNPYDEELPYRLEALKQEVISQNEITAAEIGINPSVATTAIKPEGCQPAYSSVVTSKGLKTFEELLKYSNENWDKEGWKNINSFSASGSNNEITKLYNNGNKEVLRINTLYGFELDSTSNHPWYVEKRGWVETKDLNVGDILEVDVSPKLNNNTVLLKVPSIESYSTSAKLIKYPKELSEDFSWLLGYYFGNGTLNEQNGHLSLYSEYENILEKCQSILLEIFGLESTIYKPTTKNMYRLNVQSINLVHFLKENNLLKYTAGIFNIVPEKVRESRNTSLAFLAGIIDSDGSITKNSGTRIIKISTTHEEFSKSLQSTALACGIVFSRSSISRNTTKGFVGFDCTIQSTAYMDSSSFEKLVENSEKLLFFNHADTPWRHDASTRKTRFLIKEIFSLGEMPTYGIEVENTHWYLAEGGFKSHNTTSQLTNSASGLHTRHSPYYIRRIRGDIKDPLTQFMIGNGVPWEPCVMKPDSTVVFSFPIKSPEGALTRDDLSAIDHLKLWLIYQRHYCEHKPSVTISVKEKEWPAVGAFVWEYFDEMSGVSFLPHDGGSYRQAPYEECTEQDYLELLSIMPTNINWDELMENTDNVEGVQNLACTADGCEIM